jgi:hypothetical protein
MWRISRCRGWLHIVFFDILELSKLNFSIYLIRIDHGVGAIL